jgi:hypothetical protein
MAAKMESMKDPQNCDKHILRRWRTQLLRDSMCLPPFAPVVLQACMLSPLAAL